MQFGSVSLHHVRVTESVSKEFNDVLICSTVANVPATERLTDGYVYQRERDANVVQTKRLFRPKYDVFQYLNCVVLRRCYR